MAKAPKDKKEAAPVSKKQKEDPGGVARPVSLHPLSFEEAVGALLEVKMDPEELRGKKR